MVENDNSLIQSARFAMMQLLRESGAIVPDRDRGTTYAEGHALVALEASGKLSVTKLADLLLLSEASASKILKKLRERKPPLVAYSISPDDQRVRLYSCTSAGRAKVTKLESTWLARLESVFSHLQTTDHAAIVQSLEQLNDAFRKARMM